MKLHTAERADMQALVRFADRPHWECCHLTILISQLICRCGFCSWIYLRCYTWGKCPLGISNSLSKISSEIVIINYDKIQWKLTTWIFKLNKPINYADNKCASLPDQTQWHVSRWTSWEKGLKTTMVELYFDLIICLDPTNSMLGPLLGLDNLFTFLWQHIHASKFWGSSAGCAKSQLQFYSSCTSRLVLPVSLSPGSVK